MAENSALAKGYSLSMSIRRGGFGGAIRFRTFPRHSDMKGIEPAWDFCNDAAVCPAIATTSSQRDEAMLDELFARCTMERERHVQGELLQALGLPSSATARRVEALEPADDGIELFRVRRRPRACRRR